MNPDLERLKRLAIAGLMTDVPRRKQFYLEEILKEIIGEEEFNYICDRWRDLNN